MKLQYRIGYLIQGMPDRKERQVEVGVEFGMDGISLLV